MGEMADMFLDDVIQEEAYRDDYVSGAMGMQEAYDRGFLDEYGTETAGMQAAWDRAGIGDARSVDRDLHIAELELSRSMGSYHTPAAPRERSLNSQAIKNLKNARPTCNICSRLMQPREGKFGKFYYCSCPDQPTVSDKYWQKVRIK